MNYSDDDDSPCGFGGDAHSFFDTKHEVTISAFEKSHTSIPKVIVTSATTNNMEDKNEESQCLSATPKKRRICSDGNTDNEESQCLSATPKKRRICSDGNTDNEESQCLSATPKKRRICSDGNTDKDQKKTIPLEAEPLCKLTTVIKKTVVGEEPFHFTADPVPKVVLASPKVSVNGAKEKDKISTKLRKDATHKPLVKKSEKK